MLRPRPIGELSVEVNLYTERSDHLELSLTS